MLEKVDQIKFHLEICYDIPVLRPQPVRHVPGAMESVLILWPKFYMFLNSGHKVITGEVIPMYSDIATKYILPKCHEVGL
jgi:hypothetical protein